MRAALRPLAAAALSLALAAPAHAQAPSGSTVATPRTMMATVTAFCLRGVGRAGVEVGYGTVAVDMSVIPLWSQLTIDGVDGVFTALDTGSGVIGNHIDMWVASCDEAMQWGRQRRGITWWD